MEDKEEEKEEDEKEEDEEEEKQNGEKEEEQGDKLEKEDGGGGRDSIIISRTAQYSTVCIESYSATVTLAGEYC